MSYFHTVTTNLQQVEHYIAYNQTIREVQQFLMNAHIREAIEGKSEEVYRQLNDWLRAVAHGKSVVSDNAMDKAFDYVRRNFMTFALGLKVTTGLQQVSSMAKGISMIKNSEVAKSATAFLIHPVNAEKFADGKSAMMRTRTKSYERELAELAERSKLKGFGGKEKIPDKIRNAIMWHIGKIDKVVCVILWNAKYNEIRNMGATDKDAIRKADEVIRKTQSRGGVLYMPKMYRAGGLVRAFTIFTSDLNQNVNLAFEMAGKWGMRSTPENAGQIFWNVFMATAAVWLVNNAYQPVYAAAKRALGDDEPQDWRGEEFIRELVGQYTGGIPFIGELIDAATAYAVNNAKEARGIIPDKRMDRYIGDFAPAGLEALERLIEGAKAGKPGMIFEAIAIGAGIPTRNIKRLYTGAEAVKEKGPQEWRRMIWSDRQLREETVYNSMARRIYGDGVKVEEFQKYKDWYAGLNSSERQRFREYAKQWYKTRIKEKEKKKTER